jgi:hypothetical protein
MYFTATLHAYDRTDRAGIDTAGRIIARGIPPRPWPGGQAQVSLALGALDVGAGEPPG